MAQENRYTYLNQNLNNKHISFKSGLQSALNTLIANGGATEGVFYLTTDTHRLYIGREITEDNGTASSKVIPIPVNQGISTVTSISELTANGTQVQKANAGEFYYVTGSNILCVYNGTEWVQINPDTNTNDDTRINEVYTSAGIPVTGTYARTTDTTVDTNKTYYTFNGAAFTAVTSPTIGDLTEYFEKENDNDQTIVYPITVQTTQHDLINSSTSNSQTFTSYLTISTSTLVSAVANSKVGIATTTNNDNVEIQLNGALANTDNGANIITVVGDGATSVTQENNTITISSDEVTYDLSRGTINATNTSVPITLTDADSNTDNVNIAVGANLTLDNTAAADTIKIDHSAPGTAVGGTFGNNTTGDATTGSSFKIPKITKDANGHIASIEDATITLSNANDITAVAADSNGVITLTKGNSNTITSNASLYYTLKIDDGASQNYYNQANLGSFYSASRVDALIEQTKKEIDALTYKGTVGLDTSTAGLSLPSSNVRIGDTYVAQGVGTTPVAFQPGDLIIAQGTEDENGYITSQSLHWDVVESGERDTTYSLSHNSNTTSLINETTTNAVGSITINSNTSPVTVNANNGTYTIVHDPSGVLSTGDIAFVGRTTGSGAEEAIDTTSTTLSSAGSFVVPTLKYDKYGHIVAAGNTQYTLPASENKTYTLSNLNNGVASTTIYLKDNDTGSWPVTLATTDAAAGDTGLQVTSTAAGTINISHKSHTINTSADSALDLTEGTNSNNTFISGISVDNYGHITGYTTKALTLDCPDYTLSWTKPTNNNSFSISLAKDSTNINTFTYSSSTLTFNETSTNAYSVDLLWGSF